jgi:type I restriction-modification system DNA methylase subunit
VSTNKDTELANHAWSVADLLRGDYKQSDYGKVILPFMVLRRLECALEPTREQVSAMVRQMSGRDIDLDPFLRKASGTAFYNATDRTLEKVLGDPTHAAKSLLTYVGGFSPNATEVLEKYEFAQQVRKPDGADLLYQVVGKFADLDARPRLRHRRHAQLRRRAHQEDESASARGGLRSGTQRRILGHLPLRPDDQGPGPRQHRLRQLLRRRRPQALKADYLLANPPFGVEWKKVKDAVRKSPEHRGKVVLLDARDRWRRLMLS